jgi:hypothetical protein
MRSRPPRRADSRVRTRRFLSGVVGGGVLTVSLTFVPMAFNGTVAGKPVIGKPVAAPAQPVAGRPFAVSFKVTRSDTRTPFLRGRLTARAAVAGRAIPHVQSYRGGTARVTLVVPGSAAGKALTVSVAIRDGATTVSRVAPYRVLGPPSVSVGDASVVEGNSGTTTVSFPVTLSAASAQPVSVEYATVDGSATAPGDYAQASGTLTFAPGERSKTVSVGVVADLAIEPDETFSLTLSRPVGATLAVATATGRITNDDTQTPITQGAYKGLIDGNFLFLDVVDRYVTHFRSNYIRMDCGSTGIYVYGQLDWGDSKFAIGPDGRFSVSADSDGTVSGRPAKFHDEVAGRFDGTNVSGTVLGSVEYDRDGTRLSCTSGPRPWSASLQG